VPVRRRAPTAGRRLAVAADEEPAAAPEHPGRALRGGGPLPYVALHVAQAQLVGGIGPHPRWPPQVRPLLPLAKQKVAVEVRLPGGQIVGRPVEVEVVRTFFQRSGLSATSVFPLRLTRQAVQIATTSLFFVQLLEEHLRVFPRDTFDRKQLQLLIR